MSKNDESSGLCDMEDMEFHFQPQSILCICDASSASVMEELYLQV